MLARVGLSVDLSVTGATAGPRGWQTCGAAWDLIRILEPSPARPSIGGACYAAPLGSS